MKITLLLILCYTYIFATEAVVLMYHRFGNDKYPSTNIKLSQFKEHIKVLKDGNYNILPLSQVIKAIKEKKPLPQKSIAITIDDGYISVYKEAYPLLKEANFTFTLFVNSNAISVNSKNYMSWEQIRKLYKNGVEIGNHSASHLYMVKHSYEENLKDIKTANEKFLNELGFIPKLFAYPYGEFNNDTIKLIEEMNFSAGFGQHSSVISEDENIHSLPRFALNENYGDIDRFKFIIDTHPLKVYNFKPRDTIVNKNPPNISFELDKSFNPKALNCYVAGERANLNIDENRVTFTPQKAFSRGRTKLNCTLKKDNKWYWFGKLFINTYK